MNATHSPRRTGFTLIELLMVIVIIGMLVALSSVAAYKVIVHARQTRMVVEIEQLDQATKAYKEKYFEYPPAMAEEKEADRQARIVEHLRAAFPRYAVPSYANLRKFIRQGFDKNSPGYNYQSVTGNIEELDIDRLDQGEALVFWLGGFPTPWDSDTTAAVAGRKLFGFHLDPAQPLKRDPRVNEAPRPLEFRTSLLFTFDETRLVDHDDDGWLEYVPPGSAGGGLGKMPPYVYYDYQSYVTTGSGDALRHQPYPVDIGLRGEWGTAVPYALFYDKNKLSPTRWQNPDSFQIICAGIDSRYGDSPSSGAIMRIPVFPNPEFPTGATFRESDSYGKQGYFDPSELDNLSNFAGGTIEDAIE